MEKLILFSSYFLLSIDGVLEQKNPLDNESTIQDTHDKPLDTDM